MTPFLLCKVYVIITNAMIKKYLVVQLISQNQEAFIALLNESEAGEGQGGNSGGNSGGAGGIARAPDGALQLQVTSEEKAAIDRVR